MKRLPSGRPCYSKKDATTLLGWAKELGCNYVRLAHYPHNETMIKRQTRLGHHVWYEIRFTGPLFGKIPAHSIMLRTS
jgi:beta-galactosidase/beta-glucuronidase